MNTVAYSWRCPYCNQNAVIRTEDIDSSQIIIDTDNYTKKRVYLTVLVRTCPNPACKKFEISSRMFHQEIEKQPGGGAIEKKFQLEQFQLLPRSNAKPLPNYVPHPIVEDYTEACLIKDLSPKASATLSRRCLQGMIRDFFGISKPTLKLEIDALADKVDPDTWAAVDGIRKIGNIGAHMEKDINVIVDVDSNEAEALIGLIEMLVDDWYVARFNRQQKRQAVVEIAQRKDEVKSNGKKE